MPVSARSGAALDDGATFANGSDSSSSCRQYIAADVRPVELVGRADEEVAVPRPHVDQVVRGVVDRVDERQGADRAGEPHGSRDVVDRAEGVRRGADGDELRALADLALEVVPVERARREIHPHDAEFAAALARQRLPGADVGVVVELGDDDFVAGAERAAERPRGVERQRRGVGAEDDLRRRARRESRPSPAATAR